MFAAENNSGIEVFGAESGRHTSSLKPGYRSGSPAPRLPCVAKIASGVRLLRVVIRSGIPPQPQGFQISSDDSENTRQSFHELRRKTTLP